MCGLRQPLICRARRRVHTTLQANYKVTDSNQASRRRPRAAWRALSLSRAGGAGRGVPATGAAADQERPARARALRLFRGAAGARAAVSAQGRSPWSLPAL